MPKSKLTYKCTHNYTKYRSAMLDLHERGYGEVAPEAYDTYYPDNPLGEPLLGLSFDDQKLVGQENYIRQNVGYDGAIYEAALGINTLVDPNYRLLHGVFGKLAQITIDRLKGELDLLCAFANEESKKYYLRYFDWIVASKVQVYKKAVAYSGPNRESVLALARLGRLHNDVTLTKVPQFDPAVLEPLLERYLQNSQECYFYKSTQFINWKLLHNKRYNVTGYYIVYENKVAGYCATSDIGTERRIVDILIENDNVDIFDKVLSTLSYLARKQAIKRLVIYATPHCWYEKHLRRYLFIRRWDFDFIIRDFSEKLPSADWVIHIGDFDIF